LRSAKPIAVAAAEVMGFATLNPSYGLRAVMPAKAGTGFARCRRLARLAASPISPREAFVPRIVSLIVAASLAALALPALAQQPPAPAFEKKEFNHSAWTKGIFSEAVTVKGAGKMIFLAGVGSEDENGPRGNIRHANDLGAQCEYAFDKIKRVLAAHGGNMNHVVKITSYLIDMKNRVPYGQCLTRNFGSAPLPVHTLIGVVALAFPEMMMETDVTAIAPE
jgi:2-iminobutanoate/2-iminopropanoate deaminase